MQKLEPTKAHEPDAKGLSRGPRSATTASRESQKEKAKQIALSLREWLARNPGIGTLRRLSTTSRVPYSTLKKVAAAQHPPSRETLRRLVEGAGIESLRQWLHEDGRRAEGTRIDAPDLPEGEPRSSEKQTSLDSTEPIEQREESENVQKVRRIVGTFYSLKEQLEFLKGENEKGREMFRQTMSRRDAAYVVALLQALFSEDEFQKWIFFSEYKAREKKP